MNIHTYLKIDNLKIQRARRTCLVICLLLGLVSSMVMSFYHSTEILFQFYLGYTLLRLSVFFFVCVIACSSAFDKIFKQ